MQETQSTPPQEVKEYYQYLKTKNNDLSPENPLKDTDSIVKKNFIDQKHPIIKPKDLEISDLVIPIFAGLSTGVCTLMIISFMSRLIGIFVGLGSGIITFLALATIQETSRKKEADSFNLIIEMKREILLKELDLWILKRKDLEDQMRLATAKSKKAEKVLKNCNKNRRPTDDTLSTINAVQRIIVRLHSELAAYE